MAVSATGAVPRRPGPWGIGSGAWMWGLVALVGVGFWKTYFSRLGLATAPRAITPTAYACGGLVANAWTSPSVALPADAAEQYQRLRAVDASVLQPGDVVVLGSRRAGLGQTGIYVGRGQAVVADATTGTANVRPVPTELLGLRRAATGEGRHRPAPAGRSSRGCNRRSPRRGHA